MAAKLKFAVLSGGAGTRLWPASRKLFPKQFFALGPSKNPLLIETIERLEPMGASIQVVTTTVLKNSTMGLIKRFNKNVDYLWEPSAQNTAPAIALLTCLSLKESPDTIVGVFPADHIINKPESFRESLQAAIDVAQKGSVVTLGVIPSFAADAYGYMELESKADPQNNHAQPVIRFIEKPSVYKAEELLSTEKVVWNAGIFIFKASVMAEAFKMHMPELWSEINKIDISDLSSFHKIYTSLKKESIDYGVMEKLKDIQCIPVEIGWTDLGSWEEVSKYQKNLEQLDVQCSGSTYINHGHQKKRPVFVGVSDTIVVDTDDAVLILQKGLGQSVKDAVKLLEDRDPLMTHQHLFEERPWGRFEVLFESEYCKSKRICVWPKQKLSYQSHKKRQEQWTVVKGIAHVTMDDVVYELKAGESILIPLGAKHRVENKQNGDLEFIEVQTGTYFGEDDIIRYSDDYGRT